MVRSSRCGKHDLERTMIFPGLHHLLQTLPSCNLPDSAVLSERNTELLLYGPAQSWTARAGLSQAENVSVSDVLLVAGPRPDVIQLVLSSDWALASGILGRGGQCASPLSRKTFGITTFVPEDLFWPHRCFK